MAISICLYLAVVYTQRDGVDIFFISWACPPIADPKAKRAASINQKPETKKTYFCFVFDCRVCVCVLDDDDLQTILMIPLFYLND